MENVLGLRCIQCGKELAPEPGVYTCPTCGSKAGIMDVIYDYSALNRMTSREKLSQSKDYSIFRYLPFLPIRPETPRHN